MKTRLNPLENRLHNSPTLEEVRREVAIIKTRTFPDLLAALFLSLTMLVTSCSKQEAASKASAPANEPAKAKPFEGQVFRTADDRQAITLVSQDELEMRGGDAGPDNLICKYTRQDDTLRVVKTMLGTTLAVYYKIIPDGLQANDGTVLFNPAKFLYVKALIRAQTARATWTEQLATVDVAVMERHAAGEFQQVKAQAESAAGLTDKQPEQAAQQLDAATAKLKDLIAQTRIKEDLAKAELVIARLESALSRGAKFQTLRPLAELKQLIPNSDPRMIGLREKATVLPWPKEDGSVDLGEGVAMDLVFIRPGSFAMGSDNDTGNEKPVHQVTLTMPFYMGRYEVTQEQWEAVMSRSPRGDKAAKNPVENVSWDDCQ